MSKKKEKNKKVVENIMESFNNAKKEQKKDFVSALEKALNFNPKK